tara:strand:+ start:2184 stop:2420 length:237 start_codon:yes stop_codon:yes gene_type:complete
MRWRRASRDQSSSKGTSDAAARLLARGGAAAAAPQRFDALGSWRIVALRRADASSSRHSASEAIVSETAAVAALAEDA